MFQNRGSDVRRQMELFESMYDSDDFDMDKFIQPLVTKCSILDEEIDVEVLRNNFLELLIQNKNVKRAASSSDVNPEEGNDEDKEQEM